MRREYIKLCISRLLLKPSTMISASIAVDGKFQFLKHVFFRFCVVFISSLTYAAVLIPYANKQNFSCFSSNNTGLKIKLTNIFIFYKI